MSTTTTHPPLVCVVGDDGSVRESVGGLIREETKAGTVDILSKPCDADTLRSRGRCSSTAAAS